MNHEVVTGKIAFFMIALIEYSSFAGYRATEEEKPAGVLERETDITQLIGPLTGKRKSR